MIVLKGKNIVGSLNDLQTRTSILLTRELAQGINESMLKGSYGKKGRSRWINESICAYRDVWEKELVNDKFEAIDQAASGGTEHITLTIDKQNMDFVTQIKTLMQSQGAKIRDPLSRLIAVSVTLRLIREKIL